MKDIQQLIKKNSQEGRYEDIFPKTFIDAVKDKESEVSLEEILQGFNMYFLSYNGSKALTRCKIPTILRKEGLWITYVLYDHTVVTEWYNSNQIDDNSWSMDSNWRIASNNLVGDISISSDGYWVVNGVVTTTKAQGEQGITPMLRVGSNNHLQVSYTNGSSWIDVSEFTNNLHIKGYVATVGTLPSTAVQGNIYGVGPTYDPSDTEHTNPIYQLYVKDSTGWVNNGRFTSISAGVVQELGNSETAVMSQAGVTSALNSNFKRFRGDTLNRPILTTDDAGYPYYDTTIGKYIVWNGGSWVNLDGTSLGQ